MSDSNRVRLIYVPESTYGTTPVDSAAWETARFTSEKFGAEVQTTESGEIRSDRMISDLPKVGTSVPGGFAFELSQGTYDDFLEAVLGGEWTTDVLKVGVNDYSFTFEKEFQDIAGSNIERFTGVRVGEMSLAFEYGALTTGEFTMAGNGVTVTGISAVGAGSVADPSTSEVFNNSSNISGVKIDGVASDACFRSLNLAISANLRPQECLGNDAPANQIKGSLAVSGDFVLYLEDLDLEGKKISNTSFSLEFTISRGGQGYTFFFPNLKIGGSSPASSGKDQDVFLEASFTALYDATEDSSITITRF